MKTLSSLLSIGALAIGLTATAQTATRKVEKIDIDKSIDDNGKTLHIKILGTKGGKALKFDRTYYVKGMSKLQRDSITKHVIDSLGVN
jgi:hypothetical protein